MLDLIPPVISALGIATTVSKEPVVVDVVEKLMDVFGSPDKEVEAKLHKTIEGRKGTHRDRPTTRTRTERERSVAKKDEAKGERVFDFEADDEGDAIIVYDFAFDSLLEDEFFKPGRAYDIMTGYTGTADIPSFRPSSEIKTPPAKRRHVTVPPDVSPIQLKEPRKPVIERAKTEPVEGYDNPLVNLTDRTVPLFLDSLMIRKRTETLSPREDLAAKQKEFELKMKHADNNANHKTLYIPTNHYPRFRLFF